MASGLPNLLQSVAQGKCIYPCMQAILSNNCASCKEGNKYNALINLHVLSNPIFQHLRTLCPFVFGIPLQFARICGDAI
jgi:hypothetical protein